MSEFEEYLAKLRRGEGMAGVRFPRLLPEQVKAMNGPKRPVYGPLNVLDPWNKIEGRTAWYLQGTMCKAIVRMRIRRQRQKQRRADQARPRFEYSGHPYLAGGI